MSLGYINHKSAIAGAHITPGNVDDRVPLAKLTAGLKGILLADKGYIYAEWFEKLWKKGLPEIINGVEFKDGLPQTKTAA